MANGVISLGIGTGTASVGLFITLGLESSDSAAAPTAGPGVVEIWPGYEAMTVRLMKSANLPVAVKSKNSVVLE